VYVAEVAVGSSYMQTLRISSMPEPGIDPALIS